MTSKKWLAASIAAIGLTTVAGTSAFALQDGGGGGGGGGGGDAGSIDNLDFDTGRVDVDNRDACRNPDSDDGEASARCRGFNTGGTTARLTLRTGNGGRGGGGGFGGRGGDRTTIRRAGGGFPF